MLSYIFFLTISIEQSVMYCSIHEAWENNNTLESLSRSIQHNVSKQTNNTYTNEHFENAEILPNQSNRISDLNNDNYLTDDTPIYSEDSDIFLPTENEIIDEPELSVDNSINVFPLTETETDKNTVTFKMCESVFKYILSNKSYRNKLENKYKIKILNKYIRDNFLTKLLGGETKEIITIILISIFIILVLDIFVNLGKNISFKK